MSEEIRIILKNGEPRPISDFDTEETIDILHKTAENLTNRLRANRLEPCPFCGTEVSIDDIRYIDDGGGDDNFLSQVICPECGACGPIGCAREPAAKHWNTRE